MHSIRSAKTLRGSTAALVCAIAYGFPTYSLAVDLNPGGDWAVRWDNTVKYSNGYRLRDPAASQLTNFNLDDGDRAFNRGLMSNRFDLLSEFDVQRDGFGLRTSASAWYDTVYNERNDNSSVATVNHSSVAVDQFTSKTRDIAGRRAELLDAFAFGRFDLDDTRRLSVRAGRYSLLWGNSLFFGANGIAKGMAPVDVQKLNIPGSQAKETLMPVPQASATLQLSDDTSVESFIQFKFKPTRLAPAGSFFSPTDWLGDGSEQFLLTPNFKLNRDADIRGPNQHNIGLALNTRSETLGTDFGIYALRFQDTSPQTVVQPAKGAYFLAYPQNTRLLGLSFARLVGDANVSGEISARWGQALFSVNGGNAIASPATDATSLDLANNSLWPTGRTLHMNVSVVQIFNSSALWDSANLVGELMANKVMHVDRNADHIDPDKSRSAAAFRAIFTPTYFQVFPGLDLSPSVNFGWALRGNSMIDSGSLPFGGSPNHGGDLVLGIGAVYRNKYSFNLSWINYLGHAATQPFLDRDYIRFDMQTSF